MKPTLESIFSSNSNTPVNAKPTLSDIFKGSAANPNAAPAAPTIAKPEDAAFKIATDNNAQNNRNAVVDNAKGLIGDWQKRANSISDVFQSGMQGKVLSPSEILTGGAKIAAEASGGIADVFSRGFKTLTDIISNDPSLQNIAGKKGVGSVLDAASNVGEHAGTIAAPTLQKIHAWEQENPKTSSFIRSIGSTAFNLLGTEAAPEATGLLREGAGVAGEAASKALNAGADAAKTALESGKTAVTDVFAAQAAKREAQAVATDVDAISNTISPKLNSKEARNALNEGRVTRGNESTVFGKRPDVITQSDEVNQAAKTIQRSIPDAAKLNDAQLMPKLDTEIGKISTNLRGEMKQVPVKLDTTGKVRDGWTELKKAQEAEPEYDAFPGSAKSQAKFESYLKELNWDITDPTGKFKAPTPKTLDDIWQARIDYDSSIPANVKNATDASAPQLQWQKTMWLQNRALLNDAIHDTASGLGDTSRQAFSDMSDLYLAKQNILSKAAVDLEGKAGLLPANKKQLLKWGVSVGGGLVGADLLLKKLGL